MTSINIPGSNPTFASIAEVQAGTDNTKPVTAAGVKASILANSPNSPQNYSAIQAALPSDYLNPPVNTSFVVNDITKYTPKSNFPAKLTFIQNSSRATFNGFVSLFRVILNNAEVGRKVNFYVLRESTVGSGVFTVIYDSGAIAAELAGVNTYAPSFTSVSVLINDVVGVYVNYISTSNALAWYDSGGPVIGTGYSYNGAMTQGSTYSSGFTAQNRLFSVDMTVLDSTILLARFYGDKNGGYPVIDKTSGFIQFARQAEMGFKGKTAQCFGTSIEAGNSALPGQSGGTTIAANSYPNMFAAFMGMTMDNQSVGGSAATSNPSATSSDYTSLMETNAEKTSLWGSANTVYSWQTKLKLNDVYVWGHGYNDRAIIVTNKLGCIGVDNTAKTGTITAVTTSNYVSGANSLFLEQIKPGDKLFTSTGVLLGVVNKVISNEKLTFFGAPTINVTNIPYNTLLGTISTTAASATLTGSGTFFTTQLNVGDVIKTNGVTIGSIQSVESDTSLTLTAAATTSFTNQAYEYVNLNRQTYFGSVNQWLSDVYTLNPFAVIIIGSSVWCRYVGCTSVSGFASTPTTNDAVITANAAFANYYSLPFVDPTKKIGVTRANMSNFSSDGIHPNAGVRQVLGGLYYNACHGLQPILS